MKPNGSLKQISNSEDLFIVVGEEPHSRQAKIKLT